MTVTPEHSKEMRKGQLVICFWCTALLKVGDSSLIEVTKDEARRYPPQTLKILAHVKYQIDKARAVKREN